MDLIKEYIMEGLQESGGFIPVTPTDKVDKIQKFFSLKKKDFVEAVEALVKDGSIEITPGGIQVKVESTASGRMFRKIRRKRR